MIDPINTYSFPYEYRPGFECVEILDEVSNETDFIPEEETDKIYNEE